MGRYDQYSDEELIVRLREGETEISDYLMEKYKEFVRKKRLFRHLQVCVLTGSFTVQFKIPTDKSISR